MTFQRFAPLSVAALVLTSSALAAAPAQAIDLTIPVQCEIGTETVLSWDGASDDLRGTCGVVRVAADDATVTMPAATRLVVEGAGTSVTAKPVYDVEVTGAGSSVSTPSATSLVVSGTGSTVTVTGLAERVELLGSGSTVTADTVNVLRMRGSDTVRARKAYATRITGSDNSLTLTRADRVVLTGDRNAVTVARGRTTLRDRGVANVLDLRPRRR